MTINPYEPPQAVEPRKSWDEAPPLPIMIILAFLLLPMIILCFAAEGFGCWVYEDERWVWDFGRFEDLWMWLILLIQTAWFCAIAFAGLWVWGLWS